MSLEIEGKKGESILRYHTESNTATLIIIDSKKINVYDYNKNWELTNTVTKDKLDKSLSFVGATFFQTQPTLHFVNIKERKVISYKINNEETILRKIKIHQNSAC